MKINRIYRKIKFIIDNKWLTLNGKLTLLRMSIITSLWAKLKQNKIYKDNKVYEIKTTFDKSISMRCQDLGVYYEVFMKKNYDFVHEKPLDKIYVLDIGAHIGLASIFFRQIFPEARIICVEPDPNNLDVLVLNAKKFDFTIIKKAVSINGDRVNFIAANKGFNSKISDTQSYTVPSTPLNTLINSITNTTFWLVKMDIEGYEKELFIKGNSEWLEKTQNFVMEYHDVDYLPKYLSQLTDFNFKNINSLSKHPIIQASKEIKN